jgi:hypothetical protein
VRESRVSPGALRVAVIAAHPRHGGGVHIEHLAALLGLPPGDRRVWGPVKQAQRAGLVDIWRGWVISELPAGWRPAR